MLLLLESSINGFQYSLGSVTKNRNYKECSNSQPIKLSEVNEFLSSYTLVTNR